MKRSHAARSTVAVALALALGGCSTWGQMDRSEKGTAVGATGGAVVGAAVGGPVGAAVGAGVGGYAGHYETQPGGLASNSARTRYGTTRGASVRYAENHDTIRSVQQALNDQGYDAGAVDGVMGPNTERALRQFQQARNLRQTGRPDSRTLAALGVSSHAPSQASNRVASRASVPPDEAPNQAANEPDMSDESDQDLNQGSNQASNPVNPPNPPSQGSNQASNGSIPPDESLASDASNPPDASNPNPASNPPRH